MSKTLRAIVIHPKLGDRKLAFLDYENIEAELVKLIGGGFVNEAPDELANENILLLCHDRGAKTGKEPNENLYPFFYVGTVVALNLTVEGELASLTLPQISTLSEWMQSLGNI